eukprot:COSAG05_NODE_12818_length_453_cov_0.725989_1_plen_114_part_01
MQQHTTSSAELQFELHEAIESARLDEVQGLLAVESVVQLLASEPLLHEAVATDDLQVRGPVCRLWNPVALTPDLTCAAARLLPRSSCEGLTSTSRINKAGRHCTVYKAVAWPSF